MPLLPRSPLPALSLLLWLSCAAAAPAGEPVPSPPRAIWSGLVLATNDPHPAQPAAPLRQLAAKLKNIFGYNQFELVGEHSEKMDDPSERWLLPSKDFCLSVKTRNDPGQNYPMKIVLFQNRRRLVEFEPHLGSDSPLFIRGPLYARGQLVIVLRVIDASEIPARSVVRPALAAANPSPISTESAALQKGHPLSLAATLPKQQHPLPGPAADHSGHATLMPLDHTPLPPGPRPMDLDLKMMKP